MELAILLQFISIPPTQLGFQVNIFLDRPIFVFSNLQCEMCHYTRIENEKNKTDHNNRYVWSNTLPCIKPHNKLVIPVKM